MLLATVTPFGELPDLLLPALKDTLQMVGVTMALVVVVGTPLGVALHNSARGGLFPRAKLNAVLSWVTNLGRSLPFLVLMASIIPFTRLIVGSTIGIWAAVVPMTVAGIPFFGRLVETALREVPREVTDVARAAGGSTSQIIFRAQLSEALPGLVAGLTLNSIAMLEYSAIAGTIGAGGIGYLAITYGYQRFDTNVMIATIVLLVVLVQIVQLSGDFAVRRLKRG
ncbi:MAG: methionine ABC transporter permease [Solirubrobacterales bacterium]